MKKSLMLISFAFIFLLTLSVVSAGFLDKLWITGDVGTTTTRAGGGGQLATEISKNGDNANTFSRASSSSSQNNQEKGPRGWAPATTADGKRCWIPPAKSKGLFGRRI